MNILFITDEYIPMPSSNGACVSKLVNALKKEHHAFVLSITGRNMENTDSIRYVTYHRKPSSFKNRLIGYCQDDGFTAAIYTAASEIIAQENIESIVCLCRPVEPLIAGIRLKKAFSNIRLYGYFLDNLLESTQSNRLKTRIVHLNYTRLFKRFHQCCEKMIVLKYYRKTFSQLFGNSLKIEYVGLPSLIKPTINKEDSNKDVRIVYTGSLCAGYREPERVLDILTPIVQQHSHITVVFFSRGCEEQLMKAKQKMGERLVLNEPVSFEEAQRQIALADVLLNISNDLPYAVPGKLFEYFATGKPVLNYRFREDDPARDDYEKYPEIFNLYAYQDNDISACADFLLEQKEAVAFEYISGLFLDATPEFTVEKMINSKNIEGKRHV